MGYKEAPWEFRGRALYQLSLVRVEEARKHVPADLPLVSLFGWTLGGFYLARYSSSPAGAFDECVALAGLAWNFPTSCAWAARVYVNDRSARDHGISSVGLPSRLATFKALPLPALDGGGSSAGSRRSGDSKQRHRRRRGTSWWDLPLKKDSASIASPSGSSSKGNGTAAALAAVSGSPTAVLELRNSERGGGKTGRGLAAPVCRIEVPHLSPAWAPKIQMFLPSFSGATPQHPGLLKYTLKLTANIRPLPPAHVTFPDRSSHKGDEGSPEVLDAVLGGRPLLCLAFENMRMEVQAPQPCQPKGCTANSSGILRPAAA